MNDKTLAIRLPSDIVEALQQIAEEQNRTLSGLVRHILISSIQDD